jgi:HD-like signal output (HDOD) protein
MNVEEGFLSGLLHDVGRPVLLQALAQWRQESDDPATAQTVSAIAETYRIPLAARLIVAWDLSPRVAEAVQFQHAPQNAPTCLLQAAIVNLAIDVATAALDPTHGSPETGEPHPMLGVLNLYPEQFTSIIQNRDKILEWVNSTT